MKVNEQFEITDQQRNDLAIKLDGKKSKRMVSRDEVRELLHAYFNSVLDNQSFTAIERQKPAGGQVKCPGCGKWHNTVADQDHNCDCGMAFVAKVRGLG